MRPFKEMLNDLDWYIWDVLKIVSVSVLFWSLFMFISQTEHLVNFYKHIGALIQIALEEHENKNEVLGYYVVGLSFFGALGVWVTLQIIKLTFIFRMLSTEIIGPFTKAVIWIKGKVVRGQEVAGIAHGIEDKDKG
jgi:hypothetical protein